MQLAACQELEYIAEHMRDADRLEVFAVCNQTTVDQWLESMDALMAVGGEMRIVSGKEHPAVAIGAVRVAPHLASTWMVATDEIDGDPFLRARVHIAMVRLHEYLDMVGVRRCVCQPMASNSEIRTCLGRLGYVCEGVHPMMGSGGETFETWGRVRP